MNFGKYFVHSNFVFCPNPDTLLVGQKRMGDRAEYQLGLKSQASLEAFSYKNVKTVFHPSFI